MTSKFGTKTPSYKQLGFNILVIAYFYLLSWIFGGITFSEIDGWQALAIAILILLEIWAVFYTALSINQKRIRNKL